MRPHSDTTDRHGPTAALPPRLAQDEVRRRIIEIDSRLHLEEPRLAREFRRLDEGRAVPAVVLVTGFLVASALLLWLAVTTQTWQAGLAGVAAFIATLAIARGHGSAPRATRLPRRPQRVPR